MHSMIESLEPKDSFFYNENMENINLMEYIKWRGDLTFEASTFNEVDALILSRLSYIPFEKVISTEFDKKTEIGAACHMMMDLPGQNDLYLLEDDKTLMEKVLQAERYKHLKMMGAISQIDLLQEKQFSAITIELATDLHFISFRGTDNTIVGWKEDFNMAFMTPVPSQLTAVQYVEQAYAELHTDMILGGHSKGGNLALFATAFSSKTMIDRIRITYNFDGPGFETRVVILPEYKKAVSKMHTYIPDTSIIGQILNHTEEIIIVKSVQKGIYQHDIYSWQVEGPCFVRQALSDESVLFDRTLEEWLSQIEPEQRKDVVDAIYSMIDDNQGSTLKEIKGNWQTVFQKMITKYHNLDTETKKNIGDSLGSLITRMASNQIEYKKNNRTKKRGNHESQ